MTQPIDFTTYNPPGIYVQDDSTPFVAIVGSGGPQVVAIVGPTVGYRVHSEMITLTGTTNVLLSQTGIDNASVSVRSTGGEIFTAVTDYVLTVGGGEDADALTLPDNVLQIKRAASGSAIDSGQNVFVSYHYTDPEYFNPVQYDNFEDIKDAYGDPINNSTSAIVSPLTLAAIIAFQNGARRVLAVPIEGDATATTREDIQAGLTTLESHPVDLVVVLPVGVTGDVDPGDTVLIAEDLAAHCEAMSNTGENLFRTGIIGFETSVTTAPSAIATAVNDQRLMVAWPNSMMYYNGFVNQTVNIGGYYLAAAYGGIFTSLNVREGITKKSVRGFTGIPLSVLNTMSRATKDAYSSAGVAVTERTRDGRLVVRHGTTTDTSSINTREMSLVRSRDALVSMLYETFDRGQLIGTPIDADTPARIKGVATGVLEQAKLDGTIVDYSGVAVRQRSIDPTVVEIKFQYQPAYPLNYIVVVFSINLNTGSLDLFAQNP